MNEKEIFALCDTVRETAFPLHKFLRNGHLEKVYERGMGHRLSKLGLHVTSQFAVPVRDEDGTLLGDFVADLLVEHCLIIEIKACRALTDDHTAQLLGYLRATRIEHGLLINFGAPKLQIKKLILSNPL
jgi:GxxExxY protein